MTARDPRPTSRLFFCKAPLCKGGSAQRWGIVSCLTAVHHPFGTRLPQSLPPVSQKRCLREVAPKATEGVRSLSTSHRTTRLCTMLAQPRRDRRERIARNSFRNHDFVVVVVGQCPYLLPPHRTTRLCATFTRFDALHQIAFPRRFWISLRLEHLIHHWRNANGPPSPTGEG